QRRENGPKAVMSEGARPSRRTPLLLKHECGPRFQPGFSECNCARRNSGEHIAGVLRLGRSPSLRMTALSSDCFRLDYSKSENALEIKILQPTLSESSSVILCVLCG